MSIDLRGFDYALEPIRRQRQWQLDALRARLGTIQRQIDEAQRMLAGLREGRHRQSGQVAQALSERFDPARHARALQWLARLQTQILAGEQSLATLRDERATVQAQCLNQQKKLDVIEEHRDDCLAEFANAAAGRQANEADRDWLSRQGLLHPDAGSSLGGMQ